MGTIARWVGSSGAYLDIADDGTITLFDGTNSVTISAAAGLSMLVGDVSCDDLAVGDDATIGGTLGVTGLITASGGVAGALDGVLGGVTPAAASVTTLGASGASTLTGAVTLGSTLALDKGAAIGGAMTFDAAVINAQALDTGDAETALALGIPAGSQILGYSVAVEGIADVDSTTATIALTVGNTETLVALTLAGSPAAASANGFVNISSTDYRTTDATAATLTLSGGADNIPSAGTVSLVVHYATIPALD